MAGRREDGKVRGAEAAFLRRTEKTLQSIQDQILAKVAVERTEYHRLAEQLRIGDLSDRALEATQKERLAALEHQDRERLRLVLSAMVKMRGGRYGICESCGGSIPRRRLEALPEAPLCIACQRQLERNHSRS